MDFGGSTLFSLAAALRMASASCTLPWESNQRGDSGSNLFDGKTGATLSAVPLRLRHQTWECETGRARSSISWIHWIYSSCPNPMNLESFEWLTQRGPIRTPALPVEPVGSARGETESSWYTSSYSGWLSKHLGSSGRWTCEISDFAIFKDHKTHKHTYHHRGR